MKVAVRSEHGGFQLKTRLVGVLKEKGHEVLDVGIYSPEASDYPDAARAVSETILRGDAERGILVCGSGVGASVASNKFPGIRASLCHDTFSAHQGVEEDDMNVICLGERVIGAELAKEIVMTFLSARFSGEERFRRRLEKVKRIEKEFMK